MAKKIGPATADAPDVQFPTHRKLRTVWKRTIGTKVSGSTIERIDRALRLYVGAYAVQSNMADATAVRRIVGRVRRHASAILELLNGAEGSTALNRIGLSMQTHPNSVLTFILALQEGVDREANALHAPPGAEGNPAFDVFIHRLDTICKEAGVSTALSFNASKAVDDVTGNDDYSNGYRSPYAHFLDELFRLIPEVGFQKTRGSIAKAANRARKKDIQFPGK
jgi:hypothetical protein